MQTLSERIAAKKAAAAAAQKSNTPDAATVAEGINPPDAAKPDVMEKWTPEQVDRAIEFAAASPPVPQPEIHTGLIMPGLDVQTPAGLNLFIDCFPVKGATVHHHLENLIALRTSDVIENVRKKEPNAVPLHALDVRELKFGAGTTALVADFKANPPKGNVVVTSGGLSTTVVEALIPLADTVVRGGW